LTKVLLIAFTSLFFAAIVLAQEPVPSPQAEGQPTTAGRGITFSSPVAGELKIILLKPSIRFEDVRSTLPIPSADGSEYERLLLRAARNGVESRASALNLYELDLSAAEVCSQLDVLASRLARGEVNEEAAGVLARLAALNERYAVLVQFVRVKTGPGASWNSITGAITSSLASTLIRAFRVFSGLKA
jgi:hypothetical protein